MLEDLKKALARVQSDYQFYINCQTNPESALAGYDLSSDERLALSDPETLADMLKNGVGFRLPRITITISGKHDWVNRAALGNTAFEVANHDAKIAAEVGAIKQAATPDERTKAVVRLMELIG